MLLDSLVDRSADRASGHLSLVANYGSGEEAGRRLASIAGRALRACAAPPAGPRHVLLLVAMACFYLSAPGAREGDGEAVRAPLLQAIGPLATPSMAVLRARRLLSAGGAVTTPASAAAAPVWHGGGAGRRA